jgi:hypothetical protein
MVMLARTDDAPPGAGLFDERQDSAGVPSGRASALPSALETDERRPDLDADGIELERVLEQHAL